MDKMNDPDQKKITKSRKTMRKGRGHKGLFFSIGLKTM